MSALNSCHLLKTGNVATAKGRMSYPFLFKATLPQGETDQEKARYQLTLLFPKGVDLAALNKAVEDAAIAEWGPDYKTKYKVKKPFLKTADFPKMHELAENFPIFIRTNSKGKPHIKQPNMDDLRPDQEQEVYPGRWARITVRPWAYDHKTGGKGISLGLQNVQLLDHDEPLGGVRARADDEFEAIDTGSAPAGGGSTDDLFA